MYGWLYTMMEMHLSYLCSWMFAWWSVDFLSGSWSHHIFLSAASQQHLEYILCTAEWSHVIKQTAPLLAFSLSVFTSVWHMKWKIFFSLSSSPTEKAARVQLLRGVVKYLKWKMKVSVASFTSASRFCFFMSVCECVKCLRRLRTLLLWARRRRTLLWVFDTWLWAALALESVGCLLLFFLQT